VAHGDFYFTINATFYHFTERWGEQALIDYWQALGREYLQPLARQFEEGGPAEIARYWSAYFAGEPGGEVVVSQPDAGTVLIDVRACPAIRWLKESPAAALHPPVHPMYCQHCLYINQAMLEGTRYCFELQGGAGRCQQVFRLSSGGTP
jgi:hypothetical protein